MATNPSDTPPTASAANTTPSSTTTAAAADGNDKPPNEEDLRVRLRSLFKELKKREPLESTYKRLLLNGVVTSRKPNLPKDRFYRRIESRLRERVERFCAETAGKDPFDRLLARPSGPLLTTATADNESALRAAFTLREHKDHEQRPLLEAHLQATQIARNGVDLAARRRHLEGVALGLQNTKWRTTTTTGAAAGASATTTPVPSVVEQTEAARQAAESERQRDQARRRERERQQRQQEEEAADRARLERASGRNNNNNGGGRGGANDTTPNQVLQKYYKPMFDYLWNLEFDCLGGINPFRMVIDRHNCVDVGAPDYFDIIDTPMNLTWIQQKVENSEYDSIPAFFRDCQLMITNALKYNSDPANPYHKAAQELKDKYKAAARELVEKVKRVTKGGGNTGGNTNYAS